MVWRQARGFAVLVVASLLLQTANPFPAAATPAATRESRTAAPSSPAQIGYVSFPIAPPGCGGVGTMHANAWSSFPNVIGGTSRLNWGDNFETGNANCRSENNNAYAPLVQRWRWNFTAGNVYTFKSNFFGDPIPNGPRTLTLRWRGTGMSDLGTIATWIPFNNTPTLRIQSAVAPAGVIAVEYSMTIYIQQISHEIIDEGPPPAAPDAQLLGLGRGDHGTILAHYESEPVNTALGNYVSTHVDLSLPGRGLAFTFQRSYNSLDAGSGVLGVGWRHSFETHLVLNPDGSALYVAEDGAQLLFAPDGAGGFVRAPGILTGLAPITGGYELTRRDQVRYRFDTTGVLTSMLDRNNNQLTFAYAGGRLTTITDSVGRTISLTYDGSGKLSTLSGPPSRSVTYGYDTNGRLSTVTDLRGKVTTYTYEAAGRLETIVDANAHSVVTVEYGIDGRVSAVTDARGKRGTFAWDAGAHTSTYTDPRGGTWVDVYAGNALQSSTDPLGHTVRYTYDTHLNRIGVTDPNQRTTSFTYDIAGNMLARSAPAPLNYAEVWTYNARNDVATHRDGRNNTTSYTYDSAGNLITSTAPLSSITNFGRDPAGTGLLLSLTDPRGKVTTLGYDADSNLNQITTPLGFISTMTYDSAGRLLTSVDPRGNVVGADPAQYTSTYTYDAGDHVLTATDPLGDLTSSTYDDVGNQTSTIDATNHATTFAYDAANHLASVTDARNGVTAYTYDDVANLVSRTDANNHVTTFAYDLAQRLTSTTAPLSHVWSLTYDPAGNIATTTDANNKITTFGYDALNRLSTVTYADSSTATVTNAYDANSNGVSMTDGAGTETYAFDALNRLTTVTRGSLIFSYGYDAAGNVTSRTYPGQSAQPFVYDNDGRLSTANGATYAYDAAANQLTAATPDGLTARYSYDRAGRLLEVAHTTASATLARFTYALDGTGNRTAVTTRQGTVTYRYDELSRLTEVCWSPTTCPGGPPATPLTCVACIGGLVSRPAATINPPPGETYRSYTYDPVGNRLSEVSDLGSTTYAYDNSDRLTAATAPGPVVTNYLFDNNGNQTAAGTTTFTYDLADRLKTATVGATTETYAYAGDGVRLSASTGALASQTTKFLWDRNFGLPQVAIERNGSDALLRYYRFGLDLLRQTAGATTYYYHHDGLGSVADVTSSAGASLTWGEFYPYGSVRQAGTGAGAPAVQPFGFTGEQMDSFSGLYHLRARQYDPGTGRFLTTDPVVPAMTDPYVAAYSYVRASPLVNVDPSGRCGETMALALLGPGGAGVGGALTLFCVAIAAYLLTPVVMNAVANAPAIDIDLDISFAQTDKKKLQGLREALRNLRRRSSDAPNADAQNHWRRNEQGIEQQIRDLLRRHPQWRQDGDPELFGVIGLSLSNK
jgi:RHS repeat-associated protein